MSTPETQCVLDVKKFREQQEAAAKSAASTAILHAIQENHEVAAEYWKISADLQPADQGKRKLSALNNAAIEMKAAGQHEEALFLYRQSLAICRKIGARESEGPLLINIGLVYIAWTARERSNCYGMAMCYFKEGLAIYRGINDVEGEADANWCIGLAHSGQGDTKTASLYFDHSIQMAEENELPQLEEWKAFRAS